MAWVRSRVRTTGRAMPRDSFGVNSYGYGLGYMYRYGNYSDDCYGYAYCYIGVRIGVGGRILTLTLR